MLAERLELDKQEKKDELQSTASDEGVLLKASSTEELEEKDFHSLSRRDSEEYAFVCLIYSSIILFRCLPKGYDNIASL